MTRGRKRKHHPDIPSHIDQRKLPTGCYWSVRDRYWFANVGIPPKRKRIGGPEALMSELHQAEEAHRGDAIETLDFRQQKYHESKRFLGLSEATREDYGYCRLALQRQQTKLGLPFASLRRAQITPPLLQRLIDTIAEKHPSKAAHVKRYLALAFAWGIRRGYATENPAKALESPKEKRDPKMPDLAVMRRVIVFYRQRGELPSRRPGSLAPYLWAVAEIAYRCRMRAVEVRDLTDANAHEDGIVVRRRKGSRDNLTRWSPELREAWDWLVARRNAVWEKKRRPVPMRAEDRRLVVNEQGDALEKSTLNSAWRRGRAQAIEAKLITEDQRFGMHGLKHRGITDTQGSRADKQQASGHKSQQMVDLYDHELPVVDQAGKPSK